jgi:hypothetical protein
MDELIEKLYSLDRKELRRLAWEALLISDGPDKIDGNVTNSAIVVRRGGTGLPGTEGFTVFEAK